MDVEEAREGDSKQEDEYELEDQEEQQDEEDGEDEESEEGTSQVENKGTGSIDAQNKTSGSRKECPQANQLNAHKRLQKFQRRNESKTKFLRNSTRSQNNLPEQHKQGWRSANAFLNFIQDFKKKNTSKTGKNLFQFCGERWKSMTDEQKQPYIEAANTVKRFKQQKISESGEQPHSKSVARVVKRKAVMKRKLKGQKKTKARTTSSTTTTNFIQVTSDESDTDSETTAGMNDFENF